MGIDFIATVEKSAETSMTEKTVGKTSQHIPGRYSHEFREQMDRVMRDDEQRNESVPEQRRINSKKTNVLNKAEVISAIRENKESEAFAGEQGENATITAAIAVPKGDAPEISALAGLLFDTEMVLSADATENPKINAVIDSETEVSGIVPEESGVFSNTNDFTVTTGNAASHTSSATHTSGDLAISPDISASNVPSFHLSKTGDESGTPVRSDGRVPSTAEYVHAAAKSSVNSSSQRVTSSATDIPMNVDESSFNVSDTMREAAVLTTRAPVTEKAQLPSFVTYDGRVKADDALQLTEKAVAKEIAALNSETAPRAGTQSENAGHDTRQPSSEGDTPSPEWRAEHIRHAGNSSGREKLEAGQAKEIASLTGMNIRLTANTSMTEVAVTSGANTQGREFVTQVADRIQIQIRNGGGEIRIQLHPKELGRMDIRAEHGRDGLMARITVESREVKNLLESNLASLRQALEERGLRVDRINIVAQDDADTAVLADGGNRSGQTFAEQRHRNTARFDEDGENPDAGIETPTEEFGDESATRVRPDSRFYTVA